MQQTETNRLFYVVIPITLIIGLYASSAASTICLWVFCAFFLFTVIDPIMQKYTAKGINPILLSIALVVGAFALLTGMGFLIYKTSAGIITQLISYKTAIFKLYQDANHYIAHFTDGFSHPANSTGGGAASSAGGTQAAGSAVAQATPAAQAASSAGNAATGAPVASSSPSSGGVGSVASDVGLGVLTGLNSVISILSYLVLTPLLTFFMVSEREHFGSVTKQFFEDPTQGKKIWKQITDAITAFFLGNLALILVSFPIFVLTFWILGVKAFLSIGLLSAIFNLVPFLGFILAASLPSLDLLMNGGHVGSAFILITICFVTHFTVANVITPKILGAKLNLNATVSTVALIGCGELWGPIGLLLAIPITAVLKIALEHSSISGFRTFSSLMSEDVVGSERLRLKKK